MKTILSQIYKFATQYSIFYWILIALFLSISIFCNEYFKIIQAIKNMQPLYALLSYWILYTSSFIIPLIIWSIKNKHNWYKKASFWILWHVGFLAYTVGSVWPIYGEIVEHFASPGYIGLSKIIFTDLVRFVFLIGTLFIVWIITKFPQTSFYGLTFKDLNLKIYFKMLLFMLPFIIAAGFTPDFLDYYPRAKKLEIYNPSSHHYILFETIYGMAFIYTEIFFRGFMIMAFAKYLGPQVIIPTAVFYMAIHFGKPLAETLSSFFGGALLGYLSYHTKNIWGGIIVHLGIAWMMEIVAGIGNNL
jgi:membrane protease YdiL (CAAX protease family)